MNNSGYIKEIQFKETDDITQKIEEVFPILMGKEWTLRSTSTSGKTMEYTPPHEIITYATIKRYIMILFCIIITFF